MVSSGVEDAFGAIGGGVLAACLVPQLWKLFRRRSAADISLPFLLIYLLGLAVSFVYLYYEDAIVAWACLVVEIGCVLLMVSGKVYLDRWGPYSRRALRRARPEPTLTSSASFAEAVGLSIKDAGSTFAQLLQPGPCHHAQHLLLDVMLAAQSLQPPAHQRCGTAGGDAALERSSAVEGHAGWAHNGGGSGDNSDRGSGPQAGISEGGRAVAAQCREQAGSSSVLAAVAEMTAAALATAGMPPLHRKAQAFPSFRQMHSAGAAGTEMNSAGAAGTADATADAEAAVAPAPPDMHFLAFSGGYAAIMWHAASATLSLDLLAASDVVRAHIAVAAQQLCEQLLARWPGSRIEASSVARLQRQQAQQP